MTVRTGAICSENDTKLSWPIGLSVDCEENQMDNYVIDCTNVIYTENKTRVVWSIGSGKVFNKN